jgi:hypothetical protein
MQQAGLLTTIAKGWSTMYWEAPPTGLLQPANCLFFAAI